MSWVKSIFLSLRFTFSMLVRQRLAEALPVLVFLVLVVGFIVLVNTFTPLLPFVYSLF